MNISCNVIRDILPLYAEDMVSDDTRKLVDEHLCGCDGCAKELGTLKKAEKVPVDAETHSLVRVSNAIRKKKILTVICVLLTAASLIWGSMVFMTAPMYLTAEQAIEGVELREDGGLAIDYARGVYGHGGAQLGDSDDFTYALSCRYDWLRGRIWDKKMAALTEEERNQAIREEYQTNQVTQNEYDRYNRIMVWYSFRSKDGQLFINHEQDLENMIRMDPDFLNGKNYTRWEHDYDLWYYDVHAQEYKLIWNGGDGELPAVMPDYVSPDTTNDMIFICLFFGCLGVTALTMTANRYINSRKWKEVLACAGILTGSVAADLLISTGGDFSDFLGSRSYHFTEHLPFTVTLFVVTAFLWRRLYLMNQRDKAI